MTHGREHSNFGDRHFDATSIGGFGDRAVYGEADFSSRTEDMDVAGSARGLQVDDSFASRSVEGMGPEALATKVVSGLESRRMGKTFEKADVLIKDELKSRGLLGKDDDLRVQDMDSYIERLGDGSGIATSASASAKMTDDELLGLMEGRMNAQQRVEKMKKSGGISSQVYDRIDVAAFGASTLDASVSDGESGGAATESLKTVRRVERLSDLHKAKVSRKKLSKAMGEGSSTVERMRHAARVARHAVASAGRAILAAGKVLASAITALANPFTWIIAGAVLVVVIVISLFASYAEAREEAIDNLPEMITTEMVMTALEMQEEYGHPAGATIAQIIAESRGAYDGLSGLAYSYKNLFGMKYVNSFAGYEQLADPPYVDMGTKEWTGGGYTGITGRFCVFDSYEACIEFRSAVFLQSGTYTNNPTLQVGIEQRSSKLYAVGLADSWATSPTYAESLIEIIDRYDLTRLDYMSLEAFLFEDVNVRGQEYEDATSKQQAVADMAMRGQLWGVTGGYCQKWVATCYQKALGGNYESGCCATGCWQKWGVSSSMDNIPVGAAVYNAGSGSGGGCHSTYGHVGIYVGDGYVVSNASGVWLKETLESFQANGWYGWGWNGGLALNSTVG